MIPPPLNPEESILTNERLRLLSWGYYISGAIGAVFASFLLIYAFMFVAMSFIPESGWAPQRHSNSEKHSQSPSEGSQSSETTVKQVAGPTLWIFRIAAGGMFCVTIVGWVLAGLTIYAGRCVQNRQHRWFIFAMACYNMFWIPYGTLLAVCTIVALISPEATRQFTAKARVGLMTM